MSNGQFNKVVMIPTKNVFLAALLAFLFGPLGMFYSTVTGAIVMLILYPIVYLLTFGLGLLILQPIAAIWAAVHANSYNKKLLAGSNESPRQTVKVDVSVYPPSESPQENKGQGQVKHVAKPGIVESAMAKGLIDQALRLEAAGDEDSLEQARLLWEEALRMGGASSTDELQGHYYLGSFYLNHKNIAEGIKHHRQIILHDPNLTFLQESDIAIKNQRIGEFYKNFSAGSQSHARTEIREKRGTNAAIDFLQEQVNLLGPMAAPSVLLELGSYYGLSGNHEKAHEVLRRALDAPTYGSDFQEKAKKSAAEFLAEEAPAEPERKKTEEPAPKKTEIVRQEAPLFLGKEETKKRSPALKWAAGGTVGVGAIVGLFLVLMPNPYKEYFTKAQEAYRGGLYSEALTLINLAKEKKSSVELSNLETQVRYRIRENEARESEARLQREYADLYQKAKAAFERQDFAGAENYARLAADKKRTGEVTSLARQIQTARSRDQERERRETLRAADDAAYQLASQLNTELSYSEYIRTYPEGWNKYAALNQLATLRGRQARAQQPTRSNPVPISQFSAATGTAAASPQASDYWNDLKRELQQAMAHLERRTSATAPYSRNLQEQRRIRKAWGIEVIKSLSAANDALGRALGIAQKMTNRESEKYILNWRNGLKRVRTQLVSINGEEASYRTQRTIISEIQAYIAR